MTLAPLVLACLCCAMAQPDDRPPREPAPDAEAAPKKTAPKEKPKAEEPKKPALHPVISEVLYAVPTGDSGDANQDGRRHVSGDEFVEVHNPHDQPIELFGYTITDLAQKANQQVRFTFPACSLPPKGVAVVFNGNSATWAGPVGDAKSAPARGDDKFGGGLVFTMRLSSQRAAFGNASDGVLLKAPGGTIVQRVRWGKQAEEAVDPKIALDETAPMTDGGSVVRVIEGEGRVPAWRAHAETSDKPFSPGSHAQGEAKKPDEKEGEKAGG